MHILALCGSLRTQSLNAALLRAICRLAPATMQIHISDTIAALPLFNPDLEDDAPPAVRLLRQQILAADALLIASPEYAHGITSVMKNALDWMVSSEDLVQKPVVVLNASPRASHADLALREVLSVMSAEIIDAASITVPIIGARLDEDGIVAHADIAASLTGAMKAVEVYWQLRGLNSAANAADAGVVGGAAFPL
ncbi:MAG: NAD(P)H-dependent oxidoreductase [Burkholderiales bacterium]|nr:NAD(P)H-dependent oxidoreductase [Burkholderiales bacterium]